MELAQLLLTPRNTAHRQYEALRAYLVERLPGPEVARRYGYTYGALQQLVHQFRREPDRQFFVDSPRPGAKADDAIRQRIVELRKQNQSIYDISEALKKEGVPRTPAAVGEVLRKEGFAKLPRRGDAERPPGVSPPRPTAPMLGRCVSNHGRFAPSSAGCFCFSPRWQRSASTA